MMSSKQEDTNEPSVFRAVSTHRSIRSPEEVVPQTNNQGGDWWRGIPAALTRRVATPFLPRSRFRRLWDWIVVIDTLFLCVSVPVLVTFGHAVAPWLDGVVDLILWLDIFINFRTAYTDNRTLMVETRPWPVAERYLRTWFLFDLLAAFPWTLLGFSVALKFMRIIKINSLGKRISNSFNLIERGTSTISVVSMCKLSVWFLLLSHLLACGWHLLAHRHGGWFAANGFADPARYTVGAAAAAGGGRRRLQLDPAPSTATGADASWPTLPPAAAAGGDSSSGGSGNGSGSGGLGLFPAAWQLPSANGLTGASHCSSSNSWLQPYHATAFNGQQQPWWQRPLSEDEAADSPGQGGVSKPPRGRRHRRRHRRRLATAAAVRNSLRTRYIVSLQTAISTLLGESIAGESDAENVFLIAANLIGAVFVGAIFGNMAVLLTSMGADKARYNTKMHHLWATMKKLKVPPHLMNRVRRYYDYTWATTQWLDQDTFLSEINKPLHFDIAMHLHRDMLEKVNIFKDCDPMFIATILMRIRQHVYMPEDVVVAQGELSDVMYFVAQGNLQVLVNLSSGGKKKVATLTEGKHFGEIGLILRQKRSATVQAVTVCELYALFVDDFEEVLGEFPQEQQKIAAIAAETLHREQRSNNAVAVSTARSGRMVVNGSGSGSVESSYHDELLRDMQTAMQGRGSSGVFSHSRRTHSGAAIAPTSFNSAGPVSHRPARGGSGIHHIGGSGGGGKGSGGGDGAGGVRASRRAKFRQSSFREQAGAGAGTGEEGTGGETKNGDAAAIAATEAEAAVGRAAAAAAGAGSTEVGVVEAEGGLKPTAAPAVLCDSPSTSGQPKQGGGMAAAGGAAARAAGVAPAAAPPGAIGTSAATAASAAGSVAVAPPTIRIPTPSTAERKSSLGSGGATTPNRRRSRSGAGAGGTPRRRTAMGIYGGGGSGSSGSGGGGDGALDQVAAMIRQNMERQASMEEEGPPLQPRRHQHQQQRRRRQRGRGRDFPGSKQQRPLVATHHGDGDGIDSDSGDGVGGDLAAIRASLAALSRAVEGIAQAQAQTQSTVSQVQRSVESGCRACVHAHQIAASAARRLGSSGSGSRRSNSRRSLASAASKLAAAARLSASLDASDGGGKAEEGEEEESFSTEQAAAAGSGNTGKGSGSVATSLLRRTQSGGSGSNATGAPSASSATTEAPAASTQQSATATGGGEPEAGSAATAAAAAAPTVASGGATATAAAAAEAEAEAHAAATTAAIMAAAAAHSREASAASSASAVTHPLLPPPRSASLSRRRPASAAPASRRQQQQQPQPMPVPLPLPQHPFEHRHVLTAAAAAALPPPVSAANSSQWAPLESFGVRSHTNPPASAAAAGGGAPAAAAAAAADQSTTATAAVAATHSAVLQLLRLQQQQQVQLQQQQSMLLQHHEQHRRNQTGRYDSPSSQPQPQRQSPPPPPVLGSSDRPAGEVTPAGEAHSSAAPAGLPARSTAPARSVPRSTEAARSTLCSSCASAGPGAPARPLACSSCAPPRSGVPTRPYVHAPLSPGASARPSSALARAYALSRSTVRGDRGGRDRAVGDGDDDIGSRAAERQRSRGSRASSRRPKSSSRGRHAHGRPLLPTARAVRPAMPAPADPQPPQLPQTASEVTDVQQQQSQQRAYAPPQSPPRNAPVASGECSDGSGNNNAAANNRTSPPSAHPPPDSPERRQRQRQSQQRQRQRQLQLQQPPLPAQRAPLWGDVRAVQ